MQSEISVSQQGSQLKITIAGRFDFSILQQFRDAYTHDIKQLVAEVQIEMAKAEHLDSSGMGLLLSMKKDLGLGVGAIHLVNCRPHVKDALLAAKMDNLFKVN